MMNYTGMEPGAVVMLINRAGAALRRPRDFYRNCT